MPHIQLHEGLPGIIGPMVFRPETAGPMNELAEVLLRGPSTLTRGERELIAARVSYLNQCEFCCRSHSTFAAMQLDGGDPLVEQVNRDPDSAPISPKLRALLAIAEAVQQSGRAVTGELVDAARREDATDLEIHDTVLIAAAFCMFNRYVDGLATAPPEDPSEYQVMGKRTVEFGYLPMPPPGVVVPDGPPGAG